MNKKIIFETRNALYKEYTQRKTDYFKEFTVTLSSTEIKQEAFQIFDLLKKIGTEINELDEKNDFGKTVLYLPVLSKVESPQLFWIKEENDKLADQEILDYISYKISNGNELKKFKIRIGLKVLVIQRISKNKIQILLCGKKNYI